MIVQIIPNVILVLPSTISFLNMKRLTLTTTAAQTWQFTFGADRDELHALAGNKVERFIHVGDLVEAHFAAVGLGQRLARYHFQQQHELQSVAEVILDVLNARAGFAQVRIAPSGKRLQTT